MYFVLQNTVYVHRFYPTFCKKLNKFNKSIQMHFAKKKKKTISKLDYFADILMKIYTSIPK